MDIDAESKRIVDGHVKKLGWFRKWQICREPTAYPDAIKSVKIRLLTEQLAAKDKQIEAMREALESVLHDTVHKAGCTHKDIARQALAQLDGGEG